MATAMRAHDEVSPVFDSDPVHDTTCVHFVIDGDERPLEAENNRASMPGPANPVTARWYRCGHLSRWPESSGSMTVRQPTVRARCHCRNR